MSAANRLYLHDFDGVDTLGVVDAWPGFEFPLAKGPGLLNPQSGLVYGIHDEAVEGGREPFIPTIDGAGHGQGPFGFSADAFAWLLRSASRPGRDDYRVGQSAIFRAPGSTFRDQGVGLAFRIVDNSNYYVARLVARVSGAGPILRLVRVLAGVETVLADHDGADVEAEDLVDGAAWCAAVEDESDSSTTIRVYTGEHSASDRGTLRIEWNGTVAELRGAGGTGVELTGGVSGDDVLVAAHEAWDLSDESPAEAGDDGWVVELDGRQFTTQQLRDVGPGIGDVAVTQQLGVDGCSCEFTCSGNWVMQAGLRPGIAVRVLHRGEVRFRGKVVGGKAHATVREMQSWTALDAVAAAGQVDVFEDDGSATIYFNLDESNDYYSAERSGMTDGEALAWLFARYRAQLLYYGAIAPTGDPFAQEDLDAMNAENPGLAVSGNFMTAIAQIVARTRRRQPFVDPATGLWRMRDIADAPADSVECTAEWVKPTVTADARKARTAILFVGTRPEASSTVLTMNEPGVDPTLEPIWTPAQQAAVETGKQQRDVLDGVISGFGAEPFRGQVRAYLLVAADYQLTEDEFRGAFETGISNSFVVGNTATKVYLARADWSGVGEPDVGDAFRLTLLDERSSPHLSNAGVAMAYKILAPITVCGTGLAGAGALARQGLLRKCGFATVKQRDGGDTTAEKIEFGMYAATAEAAAAGYCDPAVVLAKPPERTIGLVNFLGPAPGGSPPVDQCVPTAAQSETSLSVKLRTLGAIPRKRIPETGFQGPTFDEWGDVAAKQLVIQVPEFTSSAQAAGLELAGEALLAVTGEKAMLVQAQIATPWAPHAKFPQHPTGYPSSRWAGLSKRATIRSKARTTGLEAIVAPVYSVTWSLFKNTTTIEAGTAAGWLDLAAEEIARAFLDKAKSNRLESAQARTAELLECMLVAPQDAVPAQPKGPTKGCDVEVVDTVRRTVKDVNLDDEEKKDGIQHVNLAGGLARAAAGLRPASFPGSPVEMPGYDGDSAQQFVEGGGSIPRSLPKTWLPGPIDHPNGGRGKYGGPTVTDHALAGKPPAIVDVYSWGTVRKKADAAGKHEGGESLEWSPNDAQGAPTGDWQPIDLSSLVGVGVAAGLPLSDATPGSYPAQLRDVGKAILGRVGIVADSSGHPIKPGDSTTVYPDGAPADHVTTLVAAQGIGGLRPVLSSLSDPGGLVLHGPVGPDGADAGLDWRVLPPGRALVLVEKVEPGAGKNGGAWQDSIDDDGLYTQLVGGGVVHKQIDAPALRSDGGDDRDTAAPPAQADSPHCFVGAAGRELAGGVARSGAGGIISMPAWSVGDVAVTAHLKEKLDGSPDTAGAVARVRLSYAVQGSTWTDPAATDEKDALEADGSATGTAAAVFLVPGGAVPPGLRKPFDLSLSVQRDGGHGDATKGVVLTGIGVDVAWAARAQLSVTPLGVELSAQVFDNQAIVPCSIALGVGPVAETLTDTLSLDVTLRADARVDTTPGTPVFLSIEVGASVFGAVDPIEISLGVLISARALGRLTEA